MTPTQKRLAEIRERVDKATPGPWYDSRTNKSIQVTKDSPAFKRGNFSICRYPTRTNDSLLTHDEWGANAEMLAASRTDIPFLLGEIDRLKATTSCSAYPEADPACSRSDRSSESDHP